MRSAGSGCLCPVDEPLVALLARQRHRFAEPGIEAFGIGIDGTVVAPETLHVVEAHAAADDQHALRAQRREGAAHGEVFGWIESATQRELHDRHIGVRKHQLERNEHAMVEAAAIIRGAVDSSCSEQVADARGEFRRTGCRPAQTIGVFGESRIVEQESGRGLRVDRELGRFPMRRDDEDGLRRNSELTDQAAQPVGHAVPGAGWRPVHEETWAGAVGQKDRGEWSDR